MPVLKKIYIIVICCICPFLAYPEGAPGGLLFTSSAEKVDNRTSLVLFGDEPEKFEDSFTVGFDLSIWDANQFGHIFRVINQQKQEVEFVFVNFYGINRMYLDFHSPITHKSVQIPISKENIDKKEILHLDILFDIKEDKVNITLRDSVYTCSPVGLKNPSFLQFAFGLYGLNLDVPQMLIRNLHIRESKGKSFLFPLGESKGGFAYDRTGTVKAPVKNPVWTMDKHFYWQAKSKFNFKNKANVAYDETNNRILFISADTILCYYPRYDNTESHKAGNILSGLKMNDVIYNPYSNLWHILGDAIPDSSTIILPDDLTLTFLNFSDERNSLHHNNFFSSTGGLYQFGGAGNHLYSNKISCYNNQKKQWEFVDFYGDAMTPRFYAAVGEGVHPDEKLIFGGFGNETGKQEHGGHNLYDLHLLNLRQKTVRKLWELREIPKVEFIPGNNLILSEDKKYFYALCYAHHVPNTTGYLYRFDLQNGSYDIMSDSVNFISEDTNTSVNLFYNKQMNEFYAIIREFSDKNETHVQVYSLLSPPITKSRLEDYIPIRELYWTLPWIIIPVAVLFVACLLLFFFYRRRKQRKEKAESSRLSHEDEQGHEQDRKVQKSAVYIFGNFTVYDKKGIDISNRFSMKVRAVFSLLLLYTNKDTGISTEKLTLKMWPDKILNEAKNVRGVTINRLRNIIEDIDGISLVHQNSQWFFTFEPPFYCDYLEYSGILHQLYSDTEAYPALMEQLVDILCRGMFLSGVHDAGIDDKKSKEEEKVVQLLKDYIIYLYQEKQYQKIVLIAATFFMIDPLNEEILDICMKSCNKLGKKSEAKALFKSYKRTHEMLTGEVYKKAPPAPEMIDKN
jgi:two-component SAPR family response regulator